MIHSVLLVRAVIQTNIIPKFKRNTNKGGAMVRVLTNHHPKNFDFQFVETRTGASKDSSKQPRIFAVKCIGCKSQKSTNQIGIVKPHYSQKFLF